MSSSDSAHVFVHGLGEEMRVKIGSLLLGGTCACGWRGRMELGFRRCQHTLKKPLRVDGESGAERSSTSLSPTFT